MPRSRRERVSVLAVAWNLGWDGPAASIEVRERDNYRTISRKHAPAPLPTNNPSICHSAATQHDRSLSTLSGHPRLPRAVIQFGRSGHLNQHPTIYAGVKLLGKIGPLYRMSLAGKTRRPRNDTAEAAAQCAQPRTAFRSCVESRSAARGRACVPARGVPRRRAAQVNSGTASDLRVGNYLID
ncbi:MAG: hypothetical protein JWM63_2894 [Gammaproteobacteria bacterium]|jgi:hypothetical protein|nr:hypothetical protein [Gammaproteobacteria bacterium]